MLASIRAMATADALLANGSPISATSAASPPIPWKRMSATSPRSSIFSSSTSAKRPTDQDLATLEPRDLRAYLAFRRQGPDALADRSISRALAAIRSFYRYLERRHGIANAQLALVRGPKLKRSLPRPGLRRRGA